MSKKKSPKYKTFSSASYNDRWMELAKKVVGGTYWDWGNKELEKSEESLKKFYKRTDKYLEENLKAMNGE